MTEAPESPTTDDTPVVVIPETVASTIAAARAEIDGEQYVPVADCVDWLLDCHNAADEPLVKNVVTSLLPQFSEGNLRTTDSFNEALDQIELALRVDHTFADSSVETGDQG